MSDILFVENEEVEEYLLEFTEEIADIFSINMNKNATRGIVRTIDAGVNPYL